MQSDWTPPEKLHTAYIVEVLRALMTLRLSVDGTKAPILAGPPRFASIPISVDVGGGRWRDAQWMSLSWHERSGWSWQVKLTQEPIARTAVYFGVALLPEPEQIAAWASTLLAHRALRLDRRPYKPRFAGTGLDAALAGYEVLARAAREVNSAAYDVGEV